jgi:hypothetical protein
MIAHICGPRVYEYEGVTFEVPSYASPMPLKKNGDPYARAGKKFYDMYRRFEALPKDVQETHRVGGGCRTVELP